ncbi:hypothetical protein A2U01_0054413, partial [Trifolium medium]|nr:hypothetical protein [Trifolium medium]
MPNSAVTQNGEAHQKFKAIEDKLRVMESFLLSNSTSAIFGAQWDGNPKSHKAKNRAIPCV